MSLRYGYKRLSSILGRIFYLIFYKIFKIQRFRISVNKIIMITNFSMEDRRPRWVGWTSNPDRAASGPWQVRLLWSSTN